MAKGRSANRKFGKASDEEGEEREEEESEGEEESEEEDGRSSNPRIPVSLEKQLLLDIEACGGIGSAFSLKDLCDSNQEEYGFPASTRRSQIQQKVNYWKTHKLRYLKRVLVLGVDAKRVRTKSNGAILRTPSPETVRSSSSGLKSQKKKPASATKKRVSSTKKPTAASSRYSDDDGSDLDGADDNGLSKSFKSCSVGSMSNPNADNDAFYGRLSSMDHETARRYRGTCRLSFPPMFMSLLSSFSAHSRTALTLPGLFYIVQGGSSMK
jgi:hypothetical protein